MEIREQIGITATEIGNLIAIHEDIIVEDDDMSNKVHTARLSLEFFMGIGDDTRALYEVTTMKEQILDFLNLA